MASSMGARLLRRRLLRPSVEMTYYSELQKAYVNQIGLAIPETRVTLGRSAFGPEVGYRMPMPNNAVLEPYIGLKGVWDFAKDHQISATGTPVANDVITGRIEAGASYKMQNGVSVRASGAYEGIGSNTYHAKQGQAFVIVPLH